MSLKIKCEKCNYQNKASYLRLLIYSKKKCESCNEKLNLKYHLSFESLRKLYLYLFLPFYLINFYILFFINFNFSENQAWFYLILTFAYVFVFLESNVYGIVLLKENGKAYSRKREWVFIFLRLLYPALILLNYFKIITNKRYQFSFIKDFKIIASIIIIQMTFSYFLHNKRGPDKVLIAQTFPPITYLYTIFSEYYELTKIRNNFDGKCTDLKCTDKLILEYQDLKYSNVGNVLKLVMIADFLSSLKEENEIESKKYFLKKKKDILKNGFGMREMSKGLTFFDPASIFSLLLIKAVDDALIYNINDLPVFKKNDDVIKKKRIKDENLNKHL